MRRAQFKSVVRKAVLGLFFYTICSSLYAQQALVFSSAKEVVSFAYSNSRIMQLQRQGQTTALAIAERSISEFLPNASVSYSESDSITKQATDSHSRSLQLSVSQLIFDGHKSKLKYDLSLLQAQFNYQNFEKSERQFQSQLMDSYYSCLLQSRNLEIQKQLVDLSQQQLLVVTKQYELGVILETEYLEYLLNCMQIEYELHQNEREYEKVLRNFKVLLEIDDAVPIVFLESLSGIGTYPLLYDYKDSFLTRIQAENIDLKSQKVTLQFQEKMMKFDEMKLMPTISLQGNMNFSGAALPLTSPSFSLQCNISFSGRHMNTSASNGYSIQNNALSAVNNSVTLEPLPSLTADLEKSSSKVAFLSSQIQYETAIKNLTSQVYEMIINHDDLVISLTAKSQMLDIQNRKKLVSSKQLERGELSYIDYLNELTQLASTEKECAALQVQIETSERAIEIESQIPFGELKNGSW